MKINKLHSIYLIGIGGIGMSALARFFNNEGLKVAGYDRTETTLTKMLVNEGMHIHYEDNAEIIPDAFKTQKDKVLIIYTPAIPKDHKELNYFRKHGFNIMKRSEALGLIIEGKKGIGVAGTHGKTTVSSILAHIFNQSDFGCNAFLGGIPTNYNSNFIADKKSDYVVVEADEFDRSFLHLNPSLAIITSIDPDHLDIYGNKKSMVKAFNEFAGKITRNGMLLINSKYSEEIRVRSDILKYTYSVYDKSDFYLRDHKQDKGKHTISIASPFGILNDIELKVPGKMNVENCVAAVAIAMLEGIESDQIKTAIASFKGIKRRFEYIVDDNKTIYIDDYAHHPEELKACITSVREIYPYKKITGIFQPHLYSRTRDFALEFANSLALLDELIMLDIYPAREKPIKNVNASLIFDQVKMSKKELTTMNQLMEVLKGKEIEVLLTLGAGDIDKMVLPIKKYLLDR